MNGASKNETGIPTASSEPRPSSRVPCPKPVLCPLTAQLLQPMTVSSSRGEQKNASWHHRKHLSKRWCINGAKTSQGSDEFGFPFNIMFTQVDYIALNY